MNEENKDALNNLIQSIQDKMGSSVNGSDDSNNNVSSLLNTLNSSNESSQEQTSSSNDTENNSASSSFDPSIFIKIQQIMGAMKSNTPQKDLLLSLKPFLRKSRQEKIGDYMTILSVISILESFKNKGSDWYVLSKLLTI